MRRSLVVLSITLLVCASRLLAQSTLSVILGTVQDSSGSVVSGAKLTLRNTDENTVVTGTSGPEGLFEFLNLQPGPYLLTAEHPGFAPAKSGEILLEARQTRRADFSLELASRTETAVVTAQVPVINTENGTVSDSMTSEQVMRLPTNYRGITTNPMFLVSTVPGVVLDGGLSIGGGLPTQIDTSVDGISTVDVRNHGAGVIAPSAETISEFRVSSSGNSAAFGQMGDVTIITKSGTNQVHGSAFWYHQNAALDATTYGSTEKQKKVFNTFGGSLGGPIYIPGVYDGHNRTFLWAAYEGNRQPQSMLDQASVPTLAMRQGDLNGVSGGHAVDPLNGVPFPGNQIPLTRINSVASKLFSKYYPAPNVAVPPADLNYRLLTPLNEHSDGYDLRLDQVIGPRQRVFVRWSQKFDDTLSNDYFPLQEADTQSLPSKNLVISHTFTPRPDMSNEFRFGLSLYWPKLVTPLRGKDAVADLGLRGLDLSNVGDSGGFPLFYFGDGTGFSLIGAGKDQVSQSRTIQTADVLSWIHGRHTAKFGAELRRLGQRQTLLTNGVIFSYDDFGGFVFSGAFSGNAFADLMLGLPFQANRSVLGPPINQFSSGYSFFAQDNWKISRNLTLEFGLRWELHPPMGEQSGNLANFDHITGDVIVPDHTVPLAPGFLAAIHACTVATGPGPCTKVLSASQVGLPDTLRRTYYGDWDPRLGFAWRPWPSGKTVFRGGIGIYTVAMLGQVAGAMVGQLTSDNRTFTNFQGPGAPPLFTFPNAYPGPAAQAQLFGTSMLTGTDPTLKDPRSYQWNFTIERELPWATALSISYIGIQSSGLPAMANFNQLRVGQPAASPPFPLWGSLNSIENLGFASYEGLRTELTRRLKNGVFFQASYIFSKNIGNAGGVGGRLLLFPSEGNLGVTDRFNTRYDRGVLGPSRQQRFLLTGLFPLPVGRGQALGSNWGGLRQGAFGGWELSTVSMVESGPHQTPKVGNFRGPRPDRIGNGNLANPTTNQYYDASAFVPVPAGANRLGNAGAGILEGPGTVAISAGLAKTFRMTEKFRLRMEGTFSNLPNHTNFAPPSVFVTNPQFGRLSSVQSSENAGNRTGQVAARLDF